MEQRVARCMVGWLVGTFHTKYLLNVWLMEQRSVVSPRLAIRGHAIAVALAFTEIMTLSRRLLVCTPQGGQEGRRGQGVGGLPACLLLLTTSLLLLSPLPAPPGYTRKFFSLVCITLWRVNVRCGTNGKRCF